MINMSAIIVGDGCRRMCRVRKGALEWDNNNKGYLGMRMNIDMCVLCVYNVVWSGKFHVMYGIGGRSVGLKMVMGDQEWSEPLTDDLTWVCWCGKTGKSGVDKRGEDTHRFGGWRKPAKTRKASVYPKNVYE